MSQSQTERVVYLPASDVLYVTGFTRKLKNTGNTWGQAGRWVQRYDGFMRGARILGAGWALPWSAPCEGVCSVDSVKSVTAIDDLFFAVLGRSAAVVVYDGKTGYELGRLDVAAGKSAMGGFSGWVDIVNGVTVARSNRGRAEAGRYTVFVEEDGRNKVVVYTLAFAALTSTLA
jgi:hypothetical protein